VKKPLATTCLGILAVACAALVLSGCAGQAPQKTPQKRAVASHTPAPATTPTPGPPSDVLFTISANVRSSGGSTIGIELTAHEPLAASDHKAANLVTEFLDRCGDGVGGTPISAETMAAHGGTIMRLDLTSTTTSQDFVSPLDLYLGSNYSAKAASGDGIVNPSSFDGCLGTYSWASSGTAHGIAEFDSDSDSPDLGKWRFGLYGFAVQSNTNATIESCTIRMTPLATAAKVEDVDGWATQDTSGTSCVTGYVGE
jgi:hypothetical protein